MLNLREVGKQDIDLIVSHYIEVFGSDPWNECLEEKQIKEYVVAMMSMNTFIGYIAEELQTAQFLGVSLGYIKPWYKGKEYLLDTFLVIKKYQSKGLGTLFLNKIKSDLQTKGIPTIMLDTERGMPSERFYLKNGFEFVEESVLMYSGTNSLE